MGVRVRVGVRVGEGVRVGLGVRVSVGASVGLGVRLGMGVGGSPSTRKRPTTFHSVPTKICTSYSPDCQPPMGSEHSV